VEWGSSVDRPLGSQQYSHMDLVNYRYQCFLLWRRLKEGYSLKQDDNNDLTFSHSSDYSSALF
jgi:hypothetical protein